MSGIIPSIQHSLYTHVEAYFLSLFTYNLIWRLFNYSEDVNSIINILCITPVTTIMTIMVVVAWETYQRQVNGNRFPELRQIGEFWIIHNLAVLGRTIVYQSVGSNNNHWAILYCSLGAGLGAHIGQIFVLIVKLYKGDTRYDCQLVLDNICGSISRHSFEGLFWSLAMDFRIQTKYGLLVASMYVAIMACVGYFLSFVITVPFWHFFMHLKSKYNIYLPGESQIDLHESCNYQTFRQDQIYPQATMNQSVTL